MYCPYDPKLMNRMLHNLKSFGYIVFDMQNNSDEYGHYSTSTIKQQN